MKPLIVGNWKMNPVSQKEAVELFDAVKNGVENSLAEVVICPPFMYLAELKGLIMGAQNITHEFSAEVLKSMGIEYVILGHSDVRKLGETNEMINEKIQQALAVGLKVILCVGENAGEDKEEILEKQLAGISNVIVAYEPIWAIGTGNNCSAEKVLETVSLIKSMVGDVKILYGGSVKAVNSADYLKNGGVDGLLVGGASLKLEEFIPICKTI